MEEKKQNVEAVLTQRAEDGFYKTEILDLMECLESSGKEPELDAVYLEFDGGILFGFIKYEVSDEKLDFNTGKDSEFGRAAIAVANDARLENKNGLYEFAGVKTLMYY